VYYLVSRVSPIVLQVKIVVQIKINISCITQPDAIPNHSNDFGIKLRIHIYYNLSNMAAHLQTKITEKFGSLCLQNNITFSFKFVATIHSTFVFGFLYLFRNSVAISLRESRTGMPTGRKSGI